MDTETTTEIMQSVQRALFKHGYADLTMQRIADESSVTTAAIHYHFDTKEALLNAFLDHLIEGFEETLVCESGDPQKRLSEFLRSVFAVAQQEADESTNSEFPIALMALKAQAPFHETYRQRLIELDLRMQEHIASIIRDGIEADQFDEADPEILARHVVTVINAAYTRTVAIGEARAQSKEQVTAYLERQLGVSLEGKA